MTSFDSIEALAAWVETLPVRRIVGVVGSPGAGKSSVAAALVARLPSAIVLPMDGFHLPQAQLVSLARRDRMGAPDTFDVGSFVATLQAVRAQPHARDQPDRCDPHLDNSCTSVFAPGFDRGNEEPVPGQIEILQELSTVVVEGNYLLLDSGGWEAVGPLLDVTVWVHVDRDIRQQRLIDRHIAFGKSPTDARAWALGPDESNALTIEATAAKADHRIAL